MKPKCFALALLSALCLTVMAEDNESVVFSPEVVLQKIEQTQRSFVVGWSPSTDVWIVCRQKIRLKDDMKENDALEFAEIKAKKKIADFLGSDISAKEQSYMSVDNTDGKKSVQQHFSSEICSNVNQFMRGVTLLKSEFKDNQLIAYFYVTGKMVNAAAELEKQIKSAPQGMVRSSGYSVIFMNRVAFAKRNATQVALRNAVEQVMGTTVVGQSQMMNNAKIKSKVISQTMGNIKQYRIINEGQEANNYHVVLVAEVDKKTLLDKYTNLIRSIGNPEFYIKTQDPDLQVALESFFADLGLAVTDDEQNAQFIVDAGCTYLEINDSYYGKSVQIDVKLRLKDKKTSRQLFAIKNKPRLTTAFTRQLAAEKAFKTMKKDIHQKMNQIIIDWVTNGHDVKIHFDEVPTDTAYMDSIEKAMENIPCLKIQNKVQDAQQVTFHCTCFGPTSDAEDFLRDAMANEFKESMTIPTTSSIGMSEIHFIFNK